MTDEQYYELIQPYTDAKEIMLSRLGTLKHNLYSEPSYKSIHTIQDRIKKKSSMEKKLQKKGIEATPMNAKDYLQEYAEMLMSIDQRFEHFSPAELQNITSKG